MLQTLWGHSQNKLGLLTKIVDSNQNLMKSYFLREDDGLLIIKTQMMKHIIFKSMLPGTRIVPV